MSNVYSSMK